MSERYCVVRKADGLIVNMILLDAPEPETAVYAFVLCDGSAGIGWKVTADGCIPPPTFDAPKPTPEQIAAEIEALQAKLDAIRDNAGVPNG